MAPTIFIEDSIISASTEALRNTLLHVCTVHEQVCSTAMHRSVKRATIEKAQAADADRRKRLRCKDESDSMFGAMCRKCGEEYFFAENDPEDEEEEEDWTHCRWHSGMQAR